MNSLLEILNFELEHEIYNTETWYQGALELGQYYFEQNALADAQYFYQCAYHIARHSNRTYLWLDINERLCNFYRILLYQ